MNRLQQALGHEPALAAPFTDLTQVRDVARVVEVIQVAELRADLFTEPKDLVAAAKALAEVLPTLLTVRHTSESGSSGGVFDDTERLAIYRDLTRYVDGVDIEIAATIRDEVINVAHSLGAVVIASYHNFDTTPDITTLNTLLQRGKDAGVEYVKFALRANNREDYWRQVDFLRAHHDEGLIVVAMDSPQASPITYFGPLSRSFFPSLGSHLSYAAFAEVVAPGQMAASDQADIFRQLYS